MTPTHVGPLFIVTGASGVGKTTLCEVLFQQETEYLVLDSDLLWEARYDTPQDNYRAFRELWLLMCANISQCGLPVVLCGAGVPESFEQCENRQLFSTIHYLAVIADDTVLAQRMREGRGITDARWLASSQAFNQWLRVHAAETMPPITLLDHSGDAIQADAARIDAWVRGWLSHSART
ncbi:AAA family ATPase [Lacticaseibacillus jixiensis]|uniref:AAA family ATPase n=1 Tax=Lacticaseibacillus jixiensis TaxID=3231926 RepID=UPI0036F2F89E